MTHNLCGYSAKLSSKLASKFTNKPRAELVEHSRLKSLQWLQTKREHLGQGITRNLNLA